MMRAKFCPETKQDHPYFVKHQKLNVKMQLAELPE